MNDTLVVNTTKHIMHDGAGQFKVTLSRLFMFRPPQARHNNKKLYFIYIVHKYYCGMVGYKFGD